MIRIVLVIIRKVKIASVLMAFVCQLSSSSTGPNTLDVASLNKTDVIHFWVNISKVFFIMGEVDRIQQNVGICKYCDPFSYIT